MSGYLEEFYRRRPGITEDLLIDTHAPGIGDPYDWIAAAVSVGPVLDLACGSGPMWGRVPTAQPWIGVDRSPSQVARARDRGADQLVRADALALPFPDATFGTVVCSWALMVIRPFEAAFAELARVLGPDGVVVLLVAGRRPVTLGDISHSLRLMMALRRVGMVSPNVRSLRRLAAVAAAHDLEIVVDGRRRFVFTPTDLQATRRLVDSLYLPGVPADRVRDAKTLTASWEHHEIGVPLRRVVLRRVDPEVSTRS